jgi:predicted Zn finger-like uncharacterized protein
MKFQCDRCKTRYSIGEEKIRGKVLKIRCKNCSAVITVREGQSSTGGAEAKDAAAAAADRPAKETTSAKAGGGTSAGQKEKEKGRGAGSGGKKNDKNEKTSPRAELTNGRKSAAQAATSPVLEDAFNRAMSRLPTPDPAKNLVDQGDEEGMGLDTSDASGDDGAPLEVEWYVSIDGEQEGPFSLAQAQKRVSKKQPAEEMFAWQEGFDDWLPVEKVPDLAGSLPGAAPPRKPQRASAPPMPADLAPPAASRGGKGSGAGAGLAASASPAAAATSPSTRDSKTGKSKVKEAPVEDKPLSLAALAKEQADEDLPEPTGGDFDFDIGEASRVVKLPMLVPPPRSSDAAPAAAMRGGLPGMGLTGVQKVPRGTGGVAIIGGGIVADDVNLAAAVLQPKKKNKHGLVFWVGGGASIAVVAVLMVILLKNQSSEASDIEANSPTSKFVEGFYDNNNNPTGWVPPGSEKPKDPGKTTADPGGKRGPRQPQRPVIASNNPGRISDVEDLSNPNGTSVSDRDVQEVLDAQQRFGAGLKWCFERALKTNPDLKGASNRYDVQITITAVGGVRGVSVAGKDKVLKDCLQAKVNTWNFKPAKGDFTTQFPIVFN